MGTRIPKWTRLVLFLCLVAALGAPGTGGPGSQAAWQPGPGEPEAPRSIYLPLISRSSGQSSLPAGEALRVNVPFFSGEVAYVETGMFWFGQVTSNDNYADVRIGYTASELYINLAIFDRYTWYNPDPGSSDLEAWDAATLYLDLDGNTEGAPDSDAYRFTGQLSWWEGRTNYQAAYQGNGSGWAPAQVDFSTEADWRGNAPNDDTSGEDRGWTLAFHIPFASLGLSGPPDEGTLWGMAMALHDRDKDTASPSTTSWPPAMSASQPATWGQLRFGLPTYTPPPASGAQSVTIRDGATDGEVGGGTVCGADLHFWREWGSTSRPGSPESNYQFNVQNQSDVADWPCFSKYYVTFPLEAIPSGKAILSARLTLYHFGNSGGGSWGTPPVSLIQVFTAAGDWDEATLTWNNAPLAKENVSRTWVEPLLTYPGWGGAPRTWDLSQAAAEAYAAGQPLRLVVYSADSEYHSGKYFFSTEYENVNARPKLEVTWGNP